jgi:two-component system, chemotaxis family, protein-glutamate methylesterase/glutaminase
LNDRTSSLLTGLSQAGSFSPRRDSFGPVRVAIVDDSVVIRGLMCRWLTEAGGFEVVGTYRNGIDAVAGVARTDVDVVVLDIEMPEMDGVTALPLLLKLRPGLVVIIASTLTVRNADISLRCLQLGATDYIPKPSSNREVTTSNNFRETLIEKVRNLAPRHRRSRRFEPAPMPAANIVPIRNDREGAAIQLRRAAGVKAKAIVIGASTGGPQALTRMLADLGTAVNTLPILVAQHMPVTFTSMFAEHLRRQVKIDAVEAIHDEPLRAGRVYIAPGGQHMTIEPQGQNGKIGVNNNAPVNFCRPSVDVLFESAARVLGGAVIGVTLTGMGSDGAKGAVQLAQAGASMIAQDEATSVVWGMPGAVARAGACTSILPLNEISAALTRMIAGAAS